MPVFGEALNENNEVLELHEESAKALSQEYVWQIPGKAKDLLHYGMGCGEGEDTGDAVESCKSSA